MNRKFDLLFIYDSYNIIESAGSVNQFSFVPDII